MRSHGLNNPTRAESKLLPINYSSRAPITYAKGPKGRRLRYKKLVNQARTRFQPWFSTITSSRHYQKNPAIVYSWRSFWFARLTLLFLKTGSGLIYILKNVALKPLSYYFYNFRSMVPKVTSTYATKQLLFIRVGSRITHIRDIFFSRILFATTLHSVAFLKFFDRWSGFLTVILPSSAPRLFFFLSRAELALRQPKTNFFTSPGRLRLLNWNKAGTYRLRGFRPKVRGVAKNPVDHPHGGRTKAIRFQRTPWGKPAKLK